MGIPVPGETALIAAALLAHDGQMDIGTLVRLLASAAAIIGDNVGFAVGRRYGRRLILVPGPLHNHRLKVLEHGEPFFAKHGPKAVFLGRWVSGLRIASAWLAGVEQDELADVPLLERARRHRVGDHSRAVDLPPRPLRRARDQRRRPRRRRRPGARGRQLLTWRWLRQPVKVARRRGRTADARGTSSGPDAA